MGRNTSAGEELVASGDVDRLPSEGHSPSAWVSELVCDVFQLLVCLLPSFHPGDLIL